MWDLTFFLFYSYFFPFSSALYCNGAYFKISPFSQLTPKQLFDLYVAGFINGRLFATRPQACMREDLSGSELVDYIVISYGSVWGCDCTCGLSCGWGNVAGMGMGLETCGLLFSVSLNLMNELIAQDYDSRFYPSSISNSFLMALVKSLLRLMALFLYMMARCCQSPKISSKQSSIMLVMSTPLLALRRSAMDAFSERMRLGVKQMARLFKDILLSCSCFTTSFLRNSIRKARVMKLSLGSPCMYFFTCYFLLEMPWSCRRASQAGQGIIGSLRLVKNRFIRHAIRNGFSIFYRQSQLRLLSSQRVQFSQSMDTLFRKMPSMLSPAGFVRKQWMRSWMMMGMPMSPSSQFYSLYTSFVRSPFRQSQNQVFSFSCSSVMFCPFTFIRQLTREGRRLRFLGNSALIYSGTKLTKSCTVILRRSHSSAQLSRVVQRYENMRLMVPSPTQSKAFMQKQGLTRMNSCKCYIRVSGSSARIFLNSKQYSEDPVPWLKYTRMNLL